jgi:hypothetical protein
MALRLVTAIAGERARLPFAFALFMLLEAAVLVGPALAADADDGFSATVKVDATADSAAAAREAARIDGQRRALAAVIEHLSGSSETKPPKLDDKAITDMVDSFEVTNERMSAVRYIADFTFHFRPSKVRRVVRVVDSTPAETGSKSAADRAGRPPRQWQQGDGVCPYIKTSKLTPVGRPNGWARLGRSDRPVRTRPFDPSTGDAKDLAAIDAKKPDQANPGADLDTQMDLEAVVALATRGTQDGRLAGLR